MIVTITVNGGALEISSDSILYMYTDSMGDAYAVLAYFENYAQTVLIAEDPSVLAVTLGSTFVAFPHATYSYLLVNANRVQRLEDLTTETEIYFKLFQVYNASVTADDTFANVETDINNALTPAGGSGITQLTGDVTAGPGTGSQAATIANAAVTNAKQANMAANTIKGNNSGSSASPADLTSAQATAMLDTFTSGAKGLVSASGGGSTNFLRADGAWRAPSVAAAVLSNANTSNVTCSAADTYITGSSINLAGRVQAGTTVKWLLSVTKTAAGTATPVFNVRVGTTQSTSDTARHTFTGVAQTAATDTGYIEVTMVIRSVSATSTSHVLFKMGHFNTTTGLQNKAQEQIFQSVSATYDNTGATLYAGLSINPGASGVWTIQQCSVTATNLT